MNKIYTLQETIILPKEIYEVAYKKESGNNYFGVRMDKGKYGEYLSFKRLEKIKGDHRILTNVYLPKGNGETTEVDLIYIHETGIYVLESKNYSGWIFGDEKSKYWRISLVNLEIHQKISFFLANPSGKEIQDMAKTDSEIKEAMDVLYNISSDEELRRLIDLRELAIMDEQNRLNGAKKEGKARPWVLCSAPPLAI